MTGLVAAVAGEQHLVEVGERQHRALQLPRRRPCRARRGRPARRRWALEPASRLGPSPVAVPHRRRRRPSPRRWCGRSSPTAGGPRGSQPSTGRVVVLVEQQPLLLAAVASPRRTSTNRPCSFSPSRSKCSSPVGDRLDRVVGRRPGVHVPQSHTITSPPPYSPPGMTPSKSKYSSGWSSTCTARRWPSGSRVGPFGHGPAHQHAVQLQAEVVVEPAGPVALHDEPPAVRRGGPRIRSARAWRRSRAWPGRCPEDRPVCSGSSDQFTTPRRTVHSEDAGRPPRAASNVQSMETRSIGKLDVSVVGLGCNNFGGRIDEAATQAVVDAALDAGITLFDTADIYGGTLSEELPRPALGVARDEALVATKFGVADRRGAQGRRERGVHRARGRRQPAPARHRPHRPLPAALPRRGDAVRGDARRARRAGARRQGARDRRQQLLRRADRRDRARSAPSTAARASSACRTSTACCARPPEQFGVLDACARNGIAFIPYFPLASGVLTGQVPARRGAARRHAARGDARRAREQALSDRRSTGRSARRVRTRSRSHVARARDGLAAGLAASRVGDRRGDQARAGAGERRRHDWSLTDDERAELDKISPPK